MESDIEGRSLLLVGFLSHNMEANSVVYVVGKISMSFLPHAYTARFCVCVSFWIIVICVCVYVCVYAFPFTKDFCNNSQPSCKVRGLLVNNVQATGHNPPVTHSEWTHSRNRSTWITSSNTAI